MKRPKDWPRYLIRRQLANGQTAYKWQPSKELRDDGWPTQKLGNDLLDAIKGARLINDRVAAWRKGVDDPDSGRPAPPSFATVGDVIDHFERFELPRFDRAENKPAYEPATRAEYKSRFKVIRAWAQNGATKIRHIDADMVNHWRDQLVESEAVSPHKCAGVLRVLALLFSYAERKGFIERGTHPARNIRIPTPKSRVKRCTEEALRFTVATADELNMPNFGTALALAFYTTQREADLIALTRFQWVVANDVAPEDRATLASSDGRVRGFHVGQNKTGTKIMAFLPPWARERVERELDDRASKGASCNNIILYPVTATETTNGRAYDSDRPCPNWKIQRVWRDIIRPAAIERARKSGNDTLADQLNGLQLRDLRRSGMCWLRDRGVTTALIAAISGHSIRQTQKILDTYLPADTRAAAAGMGQALRNASETDKYEGNNHAKI